MELNAKVSTLKGIGPKKAEILSKYGMDTLEDMLYFFPRKYEDRRQAKPIKDLEIGKDYLFEGKIISKRYSGNPYKKNTPLNLLIDDGTGTIEVVFFQGRYIAKLLHVNQRYSFYGRISTSFDRMQCIHPEFHPLGDSGDVRGILSVYPVLSGISQNELRKIQLQLKPLYKELSEWLPENLVQKYNLASPSYAIEHIHFPTDGRQVLSSKYRLIFEELLTLEAGLFYMKQDLPKNQKGIRFDTKTADEFVQGLPFTLTTGQLTAWEEIKRDLEADKPMTRLVQGDVGSGKTVIAEIAMYTAAKSGYQSVMMAPTEILAKQHGESLTKDFTPYGMNIGLLYSSMKAKEKREVLEALKKGDIDILVGTHAVIQPDVKFNNLGLVITDEQHRFGVNQRKILSQKGENPNVLVMTATPIPRTLAVILYGDLDISQIRTMPKGRKAIKTTLSDLEHRGKVYDFVKEQLRKGKQVYVVAPLIEDSDKIEAKSAEELYDELRDTLKPFTVALVHGNMKQEEKDHIMQMYFQGNVQVLVSTVVIEVGINVPNATVMVIENSERFGLAQLHQLRGRVGRGSDQAYCFLISNNESTVAKERNQIMCKTNDGFEIAEADLKLRGPGEIFGTRQHGLPELHLSDLIRHGDVLEKAKEAAREIMAEDPALESGQYAFLKSRMKKMFGDDIKLEL